ncbi:MAG TPA: hypothetical protein VGS41_11940 [Chthonomonadales bacterium]|nr:hypothetical protein [Chthonomonadales bacterium]
MIQTGYPSAEPAGSGQCAWCMGVPLVARRTLNDEEKRGIRADARALRLAAWWIFCTFPVLLFAFVIAFIQTDDLLARTWLDSAMFLLVVVILPLDLAACYSKGAAARDLRRDAERGYVEQFAGTLPAGGFVLPSASARRRALIRAGFSPRAGGSNLSLEILPVSRIVWSVDQIRSPGRVRAFTGIAARLPAQAAIAAQWLQPAVRREDYTIYTGRRQTSEEERAEMRSFARGWWKRIGRGLFALLFMGNVLLIKRPASEQGPNPFTGSMVFISAIVVYRMVLRIRFALSLSRIARIGEVTIYQRVVHPDTPAPSTPALPNPVVEMLPGTKTIWTLDGRPAGWRLRRYWA